jgi:hypothetical protein
MKKILCQFFGVGVLGAPVWEPDPNFMGGSARASKTARLTLLPAINLGTPGKMLLVLVAPDRIGKPRRDIPMRS